MDIMSEYLAELVHASLENRKPGPIPDSIQVDDLILIAGKHQMNTILLSGLQHMELSQNVKLNEVCYSSFRYSIGIKTEYNRLISKFEENKIKSLPLKGVVLRNIYPNEFLREMSDVDILVMEEQRTLIENVISEMGYHLLSKENHHDVYTKNGGIVIEVHYSMYDCDVDKAQYQYFVGFDKATLIEGHNYTYQMSAEDFYIYMIAHMAKHFYYKGCGIRNLVDIYIFRNQYEKELNLKYIRQELMKLGIYRFATHMKTMAEIWLDGNQCGDFYLKLFYYMLECGVYGKDENGLWNKYARTSDVNNNGGKLLTWYAFPPLYYMVTWHPWLEKAPFLLPVAWIIRGVKGVFGKKGQDKLAMINSTTNEKIENSKQIYREMGLDFKK